MKKFKDQVMLGVTSGILGSVAFTLMDFIFLQKGIVKASLRETAAQILVSKKEAKTLPGQMIGLLNSMGLSIMGGLLITDVLTQTGKEHVLEKGLLTGITSGSAVLALLSGLARNNIKPSTAKEHLSYILDHALFGVVVGLCSILLGHPSLFPKRK